MNESYHTIRAETLQERLLNLQNRTIHRPHLRERLPSFFKVIVYYLYTAFHFYLSEPLKYEFPMRFIKLKYLQLNESCQGVKWRWQTYFACRIIIFKSKLTFIAPNSY